MTPVDLSLPLDRDRHVSAFHLGYCQILPRLRVARGGSVNVDEITFVPHAHCTHTETIAHLARSEYTPSDLDPFGSIPLVMDAVLIEVAPRQLSSEQEALLEHQGPPGQQACLYPYELGDWVIPADTLPAFLKDLDDTSALIVKALYPSPPYRDYTGTNPPYFTLAWVHQLCQSYPNISHVLTNLPSLDKESSPCHVHRVFFRHDTHFAALDGQLVQAKQQGDAPRIKDLIQDLRPYFTRTITELCHFPSHPDLVHGARLRLNLQFIRINGSDALPSRPVVYR